VIGATETPAAVGDDVKLQDPRPDGIMPASRGADWCARGAGGLAKRKTNTLYWRVAGQEGSMSRATDNRRTLPSARRLCFQSMVYAISPASDEHAPVTRAAAGT